MMIEMWNDGHTLILLYTPSCSTFTIAAYMPHFETVDVIVKCSTCHPWRRVYLERVMTVLRCSTFTIAAYGILWKSYDGIEMFHLYHCGVWHTLKELWRYWDVPPLPLWRVACFEIVMMILRGSTLTIVAYGMLWNSYGDIGMFHFNHCGVWHALK